MNPPADVLDHHPGISGPSHPGSLILLSLLFPGLLSFILLLPSNHPSHLTQKEQQQQQTQPNPAQSSLFFLGSSLTLFSARLERHTADDIKINTPGGATFFFGLWPQNFEAQFFLLNLVFLFAHLVAL